MHALGIVYSRNRRRIFAFYVTADFLIRRMPDRSICVVMMTVLKLNDDDYVGDDALKHEAIIIECY